MPCMGIELSAILATLAGIVAYVFQLSLYTIIFAFQEAWLEWQVSGAAIQIALLARMVSLKGSLFFCSDWIEGIMLFHKENIQFDDFRGSALTVHQPSYLIVGLHMYQRTITASH